MKHEAYKFLNWFCQHNIKIFFVLQGTCFTFCLVIYPSFEMFITLNVWFDLLLISYLLTILQVPLVLITIGTLCILRCFMLLKSVSVLIGLFLLLILSILAGFFYYYKHVLLSLTFVKQFKLLEEEVENKLKKDLTLFWALNVSTAWLFLVCSFIHFVDPFFILVAYDLFPSFFGPASFIFSLFFILSAVTEMLLGFCFSTNFFTLLHFLCIRIVKILLGFLIEYFDFHYHCIGGIHDPHSSFEVVKSYQKNYFGAVATTREEVKSLRLYRTLDSISPPPKVAGTDFVDKIKLDALNILLIEKEEAYSTFIENAVEEASKNFTYNRAISESENRENYDKLVSERIKTA